jgi:hypothetical protein
MFAADGGLVSLDHRRLWAADRAGLTQVSCNLDLSNSGLTQRQGGSVIKSGGVRKNVPSGKIVTGEIDSKTPVNDPSGGDPGPPDLEAAALSRTRGQHWPKAASQVVLFRDMYISHLSLPASAATSTVSTAYDAGGHSRDYVGQGDMTLDQRIRSQLGEKYPVRGRDRTPVSISSRASRSSPVTHRPSLRGRR